MAPDFFVKTKTKTKTKNKTDLLSALVYKAVP